MYYLIARYYHPEHGVFLSLDPDPGDDDDILTQNGYTYANNNPVMLVDPDGHWVWAVVNAGFAIYDGYKAYKSGADWKDVAWAAGSNFLKVGYAVKAVKVLKAVSKGKVPPQLIRGRKFEERVLKEHGLKKNTKIKIGRSIPDSVTGGRITEVKDRKYVYRSRQFKDYLSSGRPVDLIVNKRTKVSKPLERAIKRSKGKIYRY